MNRDEIAQLMQDTAGSNWGTEAHFQRFAALVEERAAAAEREECRKIAANMQFTHSLTPPHCTAYNIASAISARGHGVNAKMRDAQRDQ